MALAMVSASTGAMNSVLAKLASLLGDEYHLQKGFQKQVVFLLDELKSMKGLLEKLADTEDHDPLVKVWMTQVREMAYDLEDRVDLLMYPAARSSDDYGFLRKTAWSLKTLRSRYKIANEIQELKQRVLEASERRLRYKLDDASTSSRRAVFINPRPAALYVDKDNLVGIDGPREKLIELLADGQQQLKVVAIVGFGGLGKTTLANNVYRSLKLHFDCVAFMLVSQRPDPQMILRGMLCEVGAQEQGSAEADDVEKLVDALREFLSRKRYFIVLDDVWSTSAWRIIRYALPENVLGSRILVTTRVMSVADSCCYLDKGNIFQMRPLTETEARALFFKRIFHSESEESCPHQLVAVSNDILKKCCGVPLAVITVASMLAGRSATTKVWEKIRDSIGPSVHKDPSLEDMRIILNLSYLDLPFHLKTCLLYLSMFPEDYVIDRKRLVRQWIAEGFIGVSRVEDSEEVGECYFNELINRSLVQAVGIQYDGRVNGCRVHDMILNLIISKSAEENFVITYDNSDYTFGMRDEIRRLSLDCRYGWDTLKPSKISTSHVRSLTIIGSNRKTPALAEFRALRVLDLENYGELERNYLKNIGRLYLLKYIRLHTTSVIELPEDIGELQHLETLDLTGAPRCILPESIVRLKRLMYLLVKNAKLPERFGRMQSLQELSCVQIDNTDSFQELAKLSALKTLGLKVSVDILVSSLSKLSTSNIWYLYIESTNDFSLEFLLDFWSVPCYHLREFQMKSNYYYLPTVPRWMASLVNLTLLRINIEVVGEEVLHILGELPALLALLLTVKSTASEQGLIIRSNGFKFLKQFDFTCWNSLGMVMFERDAMKNLEKLQVVFSAQGQCVANGFHFGVEHLNLLKHVVVEIYCFEARSKDVNAAEDVIKNAVSSHPNRPILELKRLAEQHIVTDEREISVHDEEEKHRNEVDNVVEREIVVEGESTTTTPS